MVKRSSKRDFAQNALRVVEIATGAPLKSSDDGTHVNSEKAKALKRALLPPADDDNIDLAASAAR